ncbi:hypothetical protein AGOR_G00051480 [Albula goreensis]|uniref:CAP-Gly domain-containing protein n=1 Tax=Albula goreensis TaxID=1534307 RepID=A0A8T3DT31_9TELE|nr:hypothetical protein AGOR_G00051480 [Albula goreensis]
MPVMSRPGFFSKTDASLRRLLPAEDVWNWGRRRVSPAEMAPAEQDEVGEPGYSGPSPGCPQKGQPPPRDSIQTDGQGMAEEEEGESETMATMVVRSQCNHPAAFVSEGDPQNHDPLSVGESGPQERVSEEETESCSDESSSTSVPLRVRSLPNSAEVSWRSQKSVCSCASLPEFQRASAVCMNVSELSSSSSDLDEDLPLDMEDSGWRGVGHSSIGDLEKPTGATPEPQTTPIGEPQQHESNTVAFNVQNDQRSQSMLPSNNNSEIMPSCCDTETGDCSHMTLQASTGSGQVDSQHSPGLRRPALDAGSGDAESSSVDSGTEEGSEALSFSSEGLSSSEEELDQTNPGADAPRGEKKPVQLSDPSEPGASNAMHHEAKVFSFPASTDVMQSNPEEQAMGRKFGVNKPGSFVSWKPTAPEEVLSEILSPVDEVLSYGSAELPPTIADDLMLPPPPPACEVITWTSEEGFPPPSEGFCWPQNEGNPLEDPSIKSDDLTSLSEDRLLPVNTGLPTGLRDRWNNDGDLKVGIEMPGPEVKGYSAGQRSWGFQGKEEQKSTPFVTLSKAEDEEEESSSDQLSCFCTGDRVLVCGSRRGQLRFKGKTHFASGYWAGVALDCPTGNHDGAFRGVRYFQCDKNCGVLVRAEDISHLLGEQDSDQETRADDPFSDEEPPTCGTKPPLGRQEESPGGDKSSGAKQEWSQSQCQAGARKCGAGDFSTAIHMYRDHIFLREVNNNPQQVSTYVLQKEKHSSTAPHSDSCTNAAQCQGGTHCIVSPLKEGALDTELEEEFCLITPGYRSAAVCFSEHLKGHRDSNDLCVGGTPSGCFRSPPQGAHQNEQNCSQTPRVCLGSPLQERKIGSHPAPHSKLQVERVGCSDRGAYDVDFLVERLMDNLLMQVVKEAEEVRKRFQRKRSSVTKDNHSQDSLAVRSERAQARPSPCQRSTPLCFSDQWHCSLASATQPKVQVQPHDPSVVHKLVEASVEALWSQAEGCIADSTEAPAYLSNEDSRRAYQQVIFDLTSDILHETLRDCWGNSKLPWELKERSSVFPVHSSETPLSDIKAVIQAEVQRELNLGRTDAQTREMMQNLCKYGMAFRDRVDNVLVRELHKEELQWVDYSLDEHSVKMQLTEEIFNILLQDTISVLNHIYAAPSDVSPPAMQPTQLSLKP